MTTTLAVALTIFHLFHFTFLPQVANEVDVLNIFISKACHHQSYKDFYSHRILNKENAVGGRLEVRKPSL